MCSEHGCACFDDPDLILKILIVTSSEVSGELQVDDYGEILRNLKNSAISKERRLVGKRFADPFLDGIFMELKTIGIDPAEVNNFLPSIHDLHFNPTNI